jgi:hypothetical protein
MKREREGVCVDGWLSFFARAGRLDDTLCANHLSSSLTHTHTQWADKFESLPSDKKIPVVGYGVGAIVAFLFIEKILHTPGLDVLLGGPTQILGILALPTIVTRYVLDKKDWLEDAGAYVNDIASRLPGLKK